MNEIDNDINQLVRDLTPATHKLKNLICIKLTGKSANELITQKQAALFDNISESSVSRNIENYSVVKFKSRNKVRVSSLNCVNDVFRNIF